MGLNGPSPTRRFQRGSYYPDNIQAISVTFNGVIHLTSSDDSSNVVGSRMHLGTGKLLEQGAFLEETTALCHQEQCGNT